MGDKFTPKSIQDALPVCPACGFGIREVRDGLSMLSFRCGLQLTWLDGEGDDTPGWLVNTACRESCQSRYFPEIEPEREGGHG